MKKRNRSWLLFAIAAGMCWGVWGVVAKLISEEVSPYANHALFTVGMILTLPFVARKIKWKELNAKGWWWGLVAGTFAITGNVAVYQAFTNGGQASIVIPLTNLYPLVTIAIAVVAFKEKLYWFNIVGLLFAVPAILLLSGETLLFVDPSAFLKGLGLNAWFLLAVAALVSWGIFSACQKVTTNYLSAEWSYTIFAIVSALFTLFFFVFGKIELPTSNQTLSWGTVAGTLNGLGVLASFAAYRAEGKASAVTTIAGVLQPVFTILLAVLFLGETFSLLELTGILLAIGGALLLSYEKKPEIL